MKQFTRDVTKVADEAHKAAEAALLRAEKLTEPYRESLIKRYPVAFTFLATLGLVTTFYGFERVIGEMSWLNERPLLILMFGLVILAVTGKLFKKHG